MEKVIRICEITGRKTVVADNLTTDEAIALVKEQAKCDEFGCYYRLKKQGRARLYFFYFFKAC